MVPFLWVLPLALYLLSFILCFDNERWYRRRAFGLLLRVMVPLAFGMLVAGAWVKLWIQIVVFSVTLFIGCMACHGELVRARPHPRFLTLFYLAAAAGGALGAVFVALVAPRLFVGYWGHHLALGACCLLTLAGWYRAGAWKPTLAATLKPPPVILILMLAMFYALTFPSNETALVKSRNFYGLLRLTESSDDNGRYVKLTHGQIMHGFQYTDKEKRRWPTAYYGFQSGIGLTLEYHPRRQDVDLPDRHLRIGIVGLGAGTVAALARQGDFIRFYEINPDVVLISENYFTYRGDSSARTEVVVGDARVRLKQELANGHPQGFDVLAIDAFTSEAIPIHLLTAECVDLYWKHLKPDGVLLFHISNRFVYLTPVVRGLADHFGSKVLLIQSESEQARGVSEATWAILTRNPVFLETQAIQAAAETWLDDERPPLIWTDDFASLWQVFKFGSSGF